MMVVTYGVALGYTALLFAAPFGVRKTLTYFVILPVLFDPPGGGHRNRDPRLPRSAARPATEQLTHLRMRA